jgi:antitoxin HicB
VREYHFTIILRPEREEGGYSVSVPSLPGCFTQGETIEECIQRAKEAIALHVEGMVAAREPVPEEDEPTQAIQIRVAA